MRRNQWLFIAVAVLILTVPSPMALAAPSEHLNWGYQLSAGPQQCPKGTLVINVNQKVVNDFDSGTFGNNWALDEYVRLIQVVEVSPGTYCATVRYKGSFTTLAGPSPGAAYNTGGTVGSGVLGTFEGGYVTTSFTGSIKSSPSVRTKGSIGTYDYKCNGDTCPGRVRWLDLYFDGPGGFADAWWGWIYHGGNNGSWVNQVNGNSGDITGD